MIEYEKKVLLTEQEYMTLLMMMRNYAPSKLQTNYYFDTYDLAMNSKGITYRIRLKDGKFEATMKSHDKNNTYFSVENTVCIKDEFDINAFNDLGLHFQGSLTTERTVVFKDAFCEIVLDRNTYLGQTDFELEVEYNEYYDRYATHLLKDVANILLNAKLVSSKEEFLSRVGQGKSKSERFFEKLEIIAS